MIIGNKETFAAQFELDDDYDGKWMLGKFCFYIQNEMVGYYDMGATLSDVMNCLNYVIQDKPLRYYPKLFSIDAKIILKEIILECYDDSRDDAPLSDMRITIADQCMDPFFIYAVNNEKDTKIIFGQAYQVVNRVRSTNKITDKYNFDEDPDNIISNIIISQKEFDTVIGETYLCLYDIYQKIEKEEN